MFFTPAHINNESRHFVEGEPRENLISLVDSATGMYYIRESALIAPGIHDIVPLSSYSLVASMQRAYFNTPSSPVEMLTNIYILWDEQNICDRIKYTSTFALYNPVSIDLSNGIVPRLGPLSLQSDTYVKAKHFKNFTTAEIKRDNGYSVAFQSTDVETLKIQVLPGSNSGWAAYHISQNGRDFLKTGVFFHYMYTKPQVSTIVPYRSFPLRGGDNFTFKGYFDDTSVIHMRQTPDLNNTICPICLRRGKDMKDCLACPEKFQRCGDAFCNAALGENSLSCPEDCGCGGRFCGHNARRSLSVKSICGNRICEKNESCSYENIDAERMEIVSFNEGALVLNRTKLLLGDELNMTSCESGGVTNEYLNILCIKYMIYFNGTFINGSCNNYRNYSCQEVSVVTVALPNDPTAVNLGGNVTGCIIKHSKFNGCAVDCGYCNDNKCGNGVCDAEESCHTCPYDCHENACEVNAMAISTLTIISRHPCTFVDLNTITCKTNDLAAYNHSHYTNIILSIDDSRYLADGINMLWSNQMLLQRYKNEFQVTNILPTKLTGSFANISIFGSRFLDLSTTVTVDDNEAFLITARVGSLA